MLRRHGPAKTNVVDVARALGMSHANVYRHFSSKAALADAVAQRWLHRVTAPLAAIAEGPGPPAARLTSWVQTLADAKRRKVLDDPELFATYHQLAEAAREVVEAHVAELRRQLAAIIRAGAGTGEFKVADPAAAAQMVLDATAVFHHPYFIQRGAADAHRLARTLETVLAGLRAGVM